VGHKTGISIHVTLAKMKSAIYIWALYLNELRSCTTNIANTSGIIDLDIIMSDLLSVLKLVIIDDG